MRILTAVVLVFLLSGCTNRDKALDRAMHLRAELLASAVTFDADITADYGDTLHTFSVYCEGDSQGNLGFRVTKPDTIADITGRIEAGEGKLVFEDTALAFPLLAEEQLSPVSAPWIFYRTLRGGFLTAAGMDETFLRLTIDDSYEEDALTLDIWLDEADRPVRAEFLYGGRRILTLSIHNFQIV